ncbi:MAG: class I SAM-dependent methyltransferase, partial [Planctomycetota bacterium]
YAGRPIPSSTDPEDWEPDLLATYQRARVLNGLRHNKPRSWEQRALLEALEALVPDGRDKPAEGEERPGWLDVLPCTGILTAKLSTERKGFRFDVAERTRDVAEFCAGRVHPRGAALAWPEAVDGFAEPADGAYDVVSCLFRLEGLRRADREALVERLARWVRPGGAVLVGFVSSASFHGWTEALRARRGGPRGVEYVLAPDPGIGPFEPLAPTEVEAALTRAGLVVEARHASQPAPPPDEVEFRTRNMGGNGARAMRAAATLLRAAARVPGVAGRRARFRFVLARRPG